ncbi:MAG: hypothetical protein LQ351_003658 [Letrouitia transgressa]|nr:MAG: hypothetical protein LQ351_003658 [Letrouitia transgressa]
MSDSHHQSASSGSSERDLNDLIGRLEQQLHDARLKLNSNITSASASSTASKPAPVFDHAPPSVSSPSHALLLLADSALPLGSFAFSSGLESYQAHHRHHHISHSSSNNNNNPQHISAFLSLALHTLATTSLPYLLAAYRHPEQLPSLDDTLDACTICPVARRASIAQGRALLTLWERAFRASAPASAADSPSSLSSAALALSALSSALKRTATTASARPAVDVRVDDIGPVVPAGHFAPLWAVVARALGIGVHDAAHVFLLNHAKAVLSAAVRASAIGPYQAQAVLGSGWLKRELERAMAENWEVAVEDAGQGVPPMDLWVGRHEMLYSRIFNS